MPNEIGRGPAQQHGRVDAGCEAAGTPLMIRAGQFMRGYAIGSGSSFALCPLTFALLASYFTEQGVGTHPVASGSFLKSDVVMYRRLK